VAKESERPSPTCLFMLKNAKVAFQRLKPKSLRGKKK
jgi:hypothetical protein